MSKKREIKLLPMPKKEEEKEEKREEIEELEEVEEKKPESKTQQVGFVRTPEIIKDLEKFLTDFLGTSLADKFLTYKKNEAESRRSYFETVSKHNRNMIYVLTVFLSAIVAFMSVLTIFGAVSGDALLFLVGTITGYTLLFIQRLVFPSKETPPTEEESA
jgi:hypothetical protein